MTPDDKWRDSLDKMPVSGQCDARCGKPATTWFGRTSCATCGDSACVNVLQDSYDSPRGRPSLGPCVGTLDEAQHAESHIANLQQANTALQRMLEQLVDDAVIRDIQLHDALARIATLEAALVENHEWHQAYTDVDGYAGSGLEQTNLAALQAHYDKGLDQKIADWHEGRAGIDQPLHEYLGMTWAEYADWVMPLKNSTATKNPTMYEPDRDLTYTALLEHLDHLLDDLLPLASDLGAFQILTAGRATVRSLFDQGLIDAVEHEALTDRVHAAFHAHDAAQPGQFDDQPSEP